MYHKPVLVKEIIRFIPKDTEVFFDGTVGHGGHAKNILENILSIKKYIGIDKDIKILQKAKYTLKKFDNKLIFINGSYKDIDNFSKNLKTKFDCILLDLGVNIEHFKDPTRGFSIKYDGPLDMRFDTRQIFTAKDLIENYSFLQLVEIFQKYGDFSAEFAKYIASEIIFKRKKQPIDTTFKLKNILKKLGLNEKKISVVFQCIRIEVNKELQELEFFLEKFINFLTRGGRIFVISYHSIEDRIVKKFFKQLVEKNLGRLINKHVIKPSWQEIRENKSARSAKLRILERF